MIYPVECPYCEEYIDMYGEDWQEYEQNEDFEVTCPHCDKVVFVSFEMDPTFTSNKADCKNGGEHDWKKQYSSYYGEYERCICGEERNKISEEEANQKMKLIMAKYKLEKINENK